MEIRMGSLVRDAPGSHRHSHHHRRVPGLHHRRHRLRPGGDADNAGGGGRGCLELHRSGVGDLLMGEVDGKRPEGFDFGNSPYEISQADVSVIGKSLVQSTRAGTVGVAAAANAGVIYLGSFVVAQATADAVRRQRPDVLSIIAMGDQGRVRSDEDEQCGIYLRNIIEGRKPDFDAVKSLIMTGGATQKFFDDKQPQYHPQDVSLALESRPLRLRHAHQPRGRPAGGKKTRTAPLRALIRPNCEAHPSTVIPAAPVIPAKERHPVLDTGPESRGFRKQTILRHRGILDSGFHRNNGGSLTTRPTDCCPSFQTIRPTIPEGKRSTAKTGTPTSHPPGRTSPRAKELPCSSAALT